MGFGSGAFGDTDLGEDPEATLARYEPVAPPAAIFLDIQARDAVLDADGRYTGTTTEEQQVALAFAVPRRSIRHAPEVGNDFKDTPPVQGEALQNELEKRARAATPFDRLLAADKVELISVAGSRPKRGELRVVVSYKFSGSNQVRTAVVGG